MSALGDGILTLADVAKSELAMRRVAEVLVRTNAILNDIPYYEMNMETYHIESTRGTLPSPYYRKANQAIPAGKSEIQEHTFNGAHFESKSEMDEAVANRGGKLEVNRWNQAVGHIQGMAIEHADLLMNGSLETSNLKTPGFFDVYSTKTLATSVTAKQVIDGGGVGSDNTSILLVCWGEQTMFGVYPKGTQMGLKRVDNGRVQILANDVNGNPGQLWGYQEQFMVDHGLVVKDYRQACRIANIDVSNLIAGAGLDLIDAMIKATYVVDSLESGTPVFYMNRTVEAWLDLQSKTIVGAGAGITYDNYQGKRILHFRGIPIKRCDAISNLQAAVV